MAVPEQKSKIDLPLDAGRDLTSAPDSEPPLNRKERPRTDTHIVSGSSNREGGYDLHPHKGDHGEAQKQGSPREEDYYGRDRGFPDTVIPPEDDE